MVLAVLFLTWPPGQGIRVSVQVAGSVADLKVVILKCLEPPSQVPLRLAETQQPAEGGMICTQQKSSFIDVGPDMADAQNYHQQLSGGCSNSFPAEVGDHLLTVLPLLGELVWLAMDTSRAFLPFIDWAGSLPRALSFILGTIQNIKTVDIEV